MELPSATTPHLVVRNAKPQPLSEHVVLIASPQLTEFLEAAARLGLDAPLAVRLAIERRLVLDDALSFPIGQHVIRPTLNHAAAGIRPSQPLSAQQSAYVRLLNRQIPQVAVTVKDELRVGIPDDLATRVRCANPAQSTLYYEAVPEILTWERAARLQGFTMTEWAFRVIGRKTKDWSTRY
jgi:hypothetical protein